MCMCMIMIQNQVIVCVRLHTSKSMKMYYQLVSTTEMVGLVTPLLHLHMLQGTLDPIGQGNLTLLNYSCDKH